MGAAGAEVWLKAETDIAMASRTNAADFMSPSLFERECAREPEEQYAGQRISRTERRAAHLTTPRQQHLQTGAAHRSKGSSRRWRA
jgi:hypothetical protein